MTVLAHFGGIDMCDVLAGGDGAVVTTGAVADHRGVIEVRRQPGIGGMAVIAVIAAGDVIDILTQRGGAVVATRTQPQYLQVIDADHR